MPLSKTLINLLSNYPAPRESLSRSHCLSVLSEAGIGQRGRRWATRLVVETEAPGGDEPWYRNCRSLQPRGWHPPTPPPGSARWGVRHSKPLAFLEAQPQLPPPSIPKRSPSSPASASPTQPGEGGRVVCVCVGRGVGGWGVCMGEQGWEAG